jgi:hypothetical protein
MSLSKSEKLEKSVKLDVWEKLKIPSMTPAPGYDGQVDEPSGAGLPAQVSGGQGYEAEDHLQVFFNTVRVVNRDITDDEVEKGVSFNIEKKFVTEGVYTVKYRIINSQTGDISDSLELKLKVNSAS